MREARGSAAPQRESLGRFAVQFARARRRRRSRSCTAAIRRCSRSSAIDGWRRPRRARTRAAPRSPGPAGSRAETSRLGSGSTAPRTTPTASLVSTSPIAETVKRSIAAGMGEGVDDVAERILAPAQRAVDVDLEPPAQHILRLEAARRQAQVLDQRARRRREGVSRVVGDRRSACWASVRPPAPSAITRTDIARRSSRRGGRCPR